MRKAIQITVIVLKTPSGNWLLCETCQKGFAVPAHEFGDVVERLENHAIDTHEMITPKLARMTRFTSHLTIKIEGEIEKDES